MFVASRYSRRGHGAGGPQSETPPALISLAAPLEPLVLVPVLVPVLFSANQCSAGTTVSMITKDWLECMLTSYYLFIEHFKGDPDIQVQAALNTGMGRSKKIFSTPFSCRE